MPSNALEPIPRSPVANRAAIVARSRPIGPRKSGARPDGAGARDEERARLALDIHDHLDSLLISLRLDLAWLDRCLAEQAGSSDDAVRTLRMQMRIRCDGMGNQLEQVAANLERIVGDLQSPVPPQR